MGAKTIVEGVGTAVSAKNGALSRALEAAMAQAVHDAIAAGVRVSDREGILAAKMAARARVRREFGLDG
jgi:hypothetical protein